MMTDHCWEADPDKRATFSQLKHTLDRLLSGGQDSSPVDLDCELQQARGEHLALGVMLSTVHA